MGQTLTFCRGEGSKWTDKDEAAAEEQAKASGGTETAGPSKAQQTATTNGVRQEAPNPDSHRDGFYDVIDDDGKSTVSDQTSEFYSPVGSITSFKSSTSFYSVRY